MDNDQRILALEARLKAVEDFAEQLLDLAVAQRHRQDSSDMIRDSLIQQIGTLRTAVEVVADHLHDHADRRDQERQDGDWWKG